MVAGQQYTASVAGYVLNLGAPVAYNFHKTMTILYTSVNNSIVYSRLWLADNILARNPLNGTVTFSDSALMQTSV